MLLYVTPLKYVYINIENKIKKLSTTAMLIFIRLDLVLLIPFYLSSKIYPTLRLVFIYLSYPNLLNFFLKLLT